MTDIDGMIKGKFERAYPNREFANVQDVAAANIYKTPYVPKETWWNAQRTVRKPGIGEQISVTHVPESDKEEAKGMVDEKVDPRFAVTAYQNMEEARRLDAEQDARTQDNVEDLRYQPEYPYEMFVQPLNRIGAMKPRETETAYFEEPLDMTEDLETHGLGLRAYRAALDAKDESIGKNKREEPEVYEFTESNTDIDGRMNAWHGADIHPEMASKFLKAKPYDAKLYRDLAQIRDRARLGDLESFVKDMGLTDDDLPAYDDKTPFENVLQQALYNRHLREPIDFAAVNRDFDNGKWANKEEFTESATDFSKAVFGNDETDAAVEDAAAEEGPDDFEAPGIKHMKDTKKERNEAVQPIVHADDKVAAANELGDATGYGDTPVGVTRMDVHVDTSSYLEDLMNRGLITPAQYFKARQAFQDGFDTGVKNHLRETARFDPNERVEDDLP